MAWPRTSSLTWRRLWAKKAWMNPVLKRAYTNSSKTVPPGVPVIDRIAELPEIVRLFNGEERPTETVPL